MNDSYPSLWNPPLDPPKLEIHRNNFVHKHLNSPMKYATMCALVILATSIFAGCFESDSDGDGLSDIEEYREGQLIGVSIADFCVEFDPLMNSKGDFSEVSGPLEDSHYHFDESEVINLMIEYENPDADSVYIDVFTGLNYNPHFRLTDSSSSNGYKASNNLEISYLGEDNTEGNHIITYRAANVFGSDTLFDFYSISLSTESDTSWSCSIPPDIRDVIEIAPIVENFTINPNLFTESVWVNLGSDYKNIKLEVFDMRGRRVGEFENSEEQTFKVNLYNLRSGMYFFNFFRDGELIIVSKTVKK